MKELEEVQVEGKANLLEPEMGAENLFQLNIVKENFLLGIIFIHVMVVDGDSAAAQGRLRCRRPQVRSGGSRVARVGCCVCSCRAC